MSGLDIPITCRQYLTLSEFMNLANFSIYNTFQDIKIKLKKLTRTVAKSRQYNCEYVPHMAIRVK